MDKMSFEEALARIGEINVKLKGGEESLEDAIKLFEEGAELSALCYERLNSAQQRIEKFKRPAKEETEADG